MQSNYFYFLNSCKHIVAPRAGAWIETDRYALASNRINEIGDGSNLLKLTATQQQKPRILEPLMTGQAQRLPLQGLTPEEIAIMEGKEKL